MFTYNIQLAGYPHDKIDKKGNINYNGFRDAFNAFPWLEQMEEYNKIQDGCSATISVKSEMDAKSLWVSIAGDSTNYLFLVGFTYFRKNSFLFGLIKQNIEESDVYEIKNQNHILPLFKLFFERQFDSLNSELATFQIN